MIRQLEVHGVKLDDINAALTAAPGAGLADHGLLTAVAARAHALLTTALDIAGAMPPPPSI